MSMLETMCDGWASTIWTLSWQVAVLAAVVWAISLACHRATPNFRYALWCVVLARLCIPFTFAVTVDMGDGARRTLEQVAAPAFQALEGNATVTPLSSTPAAPATPRPLADTAAIRFRNLLTPPVIGQLPLKAVLFAGWAMVSLGLVAGIAWRSLRARRAMRHWAEPSRPEVLALLETLCRRCGITRTVRLRLYPDAHASAGPAVTGILSPSILLPARVAEHWRLDELEPVLLHELAHLKRHDLVINLLQAIVQAVYFFHPLVWFANARIRHERELVCDDLAVLHSGGLCKRYSQSFLRVLEETSEEIPLFAPATGAGMLERRKPLARRVLRMLGKEYRGFRPLGWISLTMLTVLAAGAITLASLGIARADAAPESAAATGTANVAGRILDEATGAPVREGLILLIDLETIHIFKSSLDNDGAFHFDRLPGGNYTLGVNTAKDYVIDPVTSSMSLSLAEGENKRDIILKLKLGYSVSGKVIPPPGTAIPEDQSWAVCAFSEGGCIPRMSGSAPVNPKDGSYRISGLNGAPVYLQFAELSMVEKDHYAPHVYYPGTFTFAEAGKIAFDTDGPKDLTGRDIPLSDTGGLTLEGVVTDRETGKPLSGTMVAMCSGEVQDMPIPVYTGEDGRYRFTSLGAGKFQVHADNTPQGYVRTRKYVTLAAATSATRCDLSLTPGGTLSGSFEDETGAPWEASQTVFGYTENQNGPPCEGSFNGVMHRRTAPQGYNSANLYLPGEGDYPIETLRYPKAGAFQIAGILPGKFTLTWNPGVKGNAIREIRIGDKHYPPNALEIAAKETVRDAVIVIGGSAPDAPAKPDDAARKAAELRAHCANNLKQFGLICKMFANEDTKGLYPALSATPGQLMFSADQTVSGQKPVFPEYLTNTAIVACPAVANPGDVLKQPGIKEHPEVLITCQYYLYLGYAVTSDTDVKAFCDAYREHIAKGTPPLEDLKVGAGNGNAGGDTIFRMRDGVARAIAGNDEAAKALAGKIPVAIERLGHHSPSGGHVLYLDGSVWYVKEGDWPMTPATVKALEKLSAP